MAAVWEELRLTPREFRSEGDLILVTGKVSARSRARTVTGSTGWIWRVRDGKVVFGEVYASAADAIAALRTEQVPRRRALDYFLLPNPFRSRRRRAVRGVATNEQPADLPRLGHAQHPYRGRVNR